MSIMVKGGGDMPRPIKGRRVCCMPGYRHFGPLKEGQEGRRKIEMTVDEFEAVRLIDLEGFSQEECAIHMEVARTTAQAIYSSARVKLAECLVKGIELFIGGGTYVLSEEGVPGCRCNHCCKRKHRCGQEPGNSDNDDSKTGRNGEQTGERIGNMRIAVTYENGDVFQHFGHTGQFKVYDIENSGVKLATIVDTNGSGHGALADMLKMINVDTLICGGIGGGAKRALAETGIRLYGGVSGNADKAVESLLKGELEYDSDAECDHHGEHHGEDHGEDCGKHGCGEHHQHDHGE
jgi:predicted DNA-binding protein (UPF0251 family)/predicted Fe-Mo cluster-binding NifX family protein